MNWLTMERTETFLEFMELQKFHLILRLGKYTLRLFGKSVKQFKIKAKDIESILMNWAGENSAIV